MNRLNSEIDHFTNLDHIWWGAKTQAGQRRYDNKFKFLIKLCKPEQKNHILEIGCGDGEFTKRLIKLPSRIISTDITPAVIKRGKIFFEKMGINNIIFKMGNAENLSFKDNTFDIVCGVSILHHVNVEKALCEALRVLKPGGQIFFTEPNLLNPNIYLGINILWLRERMEFSPTETALIRWEVEKTLRRVGYSKISVINYDFLHPLTPIWAVNFVEKVGGTLETTPIIKELSGSLIIWGEK